MYLHEVHSNMLGANQPEILTAFFKVGFLHFGHNLIRAILHNIEQ